MNSLSLFSGIGGLDLGLERASGRLAVSWTAGPGTNIPTRRKRPPVPRHDRSYGTHHSKRASAGNQRRVPSHEKSRNKRYAAGELPPGKARRR